MTGCNKLLESSSEIFRVHCVVGEFFRESVTNLIDINDDQNKEDNLGSFEASKNSLGVCECGTCLQIDLS